MSFEKPEWRRKLEGLLSERWFRSLMLRIEAFERESMEDVAPELVPRFEDDDYPEWGIQAWMGAVRSDSEYTGLGPIRHFDTRAFGKIVGSKWAIFDTNARAYPVFCALNEKQIKKIDSEWWAGFVAETIEVLEKCARKYTPMMKDLRREASEVAADQGPFEFMLYSQGFAKGMEFPRHVSRRLKSPRGKREIDTNRRVSVLMMAALLAPDIESVKGEVTWEQITDVLSASLLNRIDLDVAGVKKNLQPLGFKGVGKVGRPSKRNRGE